jgi:hypothetical protein
LTRGRYAPKGMVTASHSVVVTTLGFSQKQKSMTATVYTVPNQQRDKTKLSSIAPSYEGHEEVVQLLLEKGTVTQWIPPFELSTILCTVYFHRYYPSRKCSPVFVTEWDRAMAAKGRPISTTEADNSGLLLGSPLVVSRNHVHLQISHVANAVHTPSAICTTLESSINGYTILSKASSCGPPWELKSYFLTFEACLLSVLKLSIISSPSSSSSSLMSNQECLHTSRSPSKYLVDRSRRMNTLRGGWCAFTKSRNCPRHQQRCHRLHWLHRRFINWRVCTAVCTYPFHLLSLRRADTETI